MCDVPSWLPEMVDLKGDWNDVVKRLYTVFTRDIKEGRLFCDGMPIWYDRRVSPDDYGFEEGFWHLITKERWITNNSQKRKERLPDYRRAERLSWFAPVIRNIGDKEIKFWRYLEGGSQVRLYIWLCDFDYAIILEEKEMKRGPVAFLITAFYVTGENSREKLSKKYENPIT